MPHQNLDCIFDFQLLTHIFICLYFKKGVLKFFVYQKNLFFILDYHYEYEGDNGILKHPNYPENYMNNVRGFWIIKSPPYTNILLQFILFDLEPSFSCNADYLAVYDGVTTSSPLIEKRCLYSTNSIESSGNKMLVVFHSNDRVTMKGFLASWKSKKSNRFSFGSELIFFLVTFSSLFKC